MAVVLLDPRFPAMIPVEAAKLLQGDVAYTEEVPIRVRWVIADLGGHVVDEADVLVTTDITNEAVHEHLDEGEEIIKAPSLLVEIEGDRELLAGPAGASTTGGTDSNVPARADDAAYADGTQPGGVPAPSTDQIQHSGAGVVDGSIVGTDQHTATVAGLRRTTRTEVPASVMDELEDAVALMARALRQGAWEKEQTHSSLMTYLRQETDELERIVSIAAQYGAGGKPAASKPEWLEQELCEELSDILLQVLFHAEIANRRGSFDIGHVAGALAVKLRSRAPYLFEDVERAVSKAEQDRLWAAGKKAEKDKRVEKFGESYRSFVDAKNNSDAGSSSAQSSSAAQSAGGRQEPEASQFPAQNAQNAQAAQPAQPQNAQPAGLSGLAEADKVIREAREMGISDMEIPTDIRYPMVGLELDAPGQAEKRLLDAVQSFRAHLAERQQNS
ncbi:hypothetical protein GC425_02815 [Corynebacterium sp. zg254]|uniref:NTP pyrophosphohydrolase MazG-like domain-containing protein n=1 Tax=Corynebacterium zhongnanshanii TaxID=2768834 RepID=A0ABQ6VJ24_9CORY|nr:MULTISPECIES: MazG nucleotide pyrophosphohydrolase domain-containing protein [Corynebacterium]KAB3523101.1 hypothetical protein F8377_02810 [Corynebacterium zhongnanshanii]MCR5913801.1 hypothetical protein [Corynebacterium sp. zg254]